MSQLKILFIPLDNRPVSYDLPLQIAALNKNALLSLPPKEFLGGLTSNSRVPQILEWLEFSLQEDNVDAIAVSLDTIAYGGLVSSRRSPHSEENIIKNLKKFRNTVENAAQKPLIYAFSSIMRISDSYVNEEEKLYWDKYGGEIFRYSFLTHKCAKKPNDKEIKELQRLKTRIPDEILEDYIKTRKRNFRINNLYLEWVEEGFIHFLAYSKDDTGLFGMNILEAKSLESMIQEKNLSGGVKIITGADEIPCCLLSKLLVNISGNIPKIYPIFSTKNGRNVVSRYEDKTIGENTAAQVRLCGGKVADSEAQADILLLVHTPAKVQNDHCLRIYEDEDNHEGVSFSYDLIKNSIKDAKKPFIIADISYANGGDNQLMEKLLEFIEMDTGLSKIYGYAGWNTSGNTLGSVISTGIWRFLAEKNSSVDLEAFKKLMFIRILDDWGFQANIRQKIRDYSPEADELTLKEAMLPLASILSKKLGLNTDLYSVYFRYPWNRTFEVQISF